MVGKLYEIHVSDDDTTNVDTLDVTNQFKIVQKAHRLLVETNKWIPVKDITNGMRIYREYPIYHGKVATIEDNDALKYINSILKFHRDIGLIKLEASHGGNTHFEYKMNLDWDNYQVQ